MKNFLSSKTIQRAILGAEIFIALIMLIYIIGKDWSYLRPISMFTLSIDCTCLIINIIFFFGIIGSKEDFNINFAAICVCDFIALLGEAGAWITENDPNTVFWAWVCDTILFLGGLLIAVSFYYLASSMSLQTNNTSKPKEIPKKQKVCNAIINVFALIGFVMVFINLFTGMIFSVDEMGTYIKGSLYNFFYIVPYFIWILAACTLIFAKIKAKMKLFVLALLVVPVAANVVSILAIDISITYSTALIALGMLYLYYYKGLESENRSLSKSFGRFLSDDIVNQLANNKYGEPISSRRFRSTLLISDIRDFTRISEAMEAADLMTMTNHYYGVMMEVLTSCGGITIEFMGDGIKAAFGAAKRRTDHAEAALKCAIKMQKAMTDINIWNEENGFPKIEIGIGVHSGPMIFGSLGDEKRFRYGAIGTEVSVCSFVEDQTFGGQILFSEYTLDEITVPVDAKYFDTFIYDEIGREMKLYELRGIDGETLTRDNDAMEELDHPIPVSVYISMKKTYSPNAISGQITSMSRDEAILRTEEPLSRHVLIMFKMDSDNVNAKVMRKTEGYNTYLIHFTGRIESKKNIQQ